MIEPWMHEKLKNDIGIDRYNHTIGVMETSKELARIYKCDEEKVEIASFLHDCGKIPNKINLLKMASDFDIMLNDVMINNIELIHGPLGAKIAENVYNIKDKEVLDAIYYHTTGRENMTLLEKIIYIADYIEPSRNFQGVDRIRKLAYVNLNESILLAMNNTLMYVIDNDWLIHEDTIKARNDLIIQKCLE